MILFYPDIPRYPSRVWDICEKRKIPYHNDPYKDHDLQFYWSYHKDVRIPDRYDSFADVNAGCWDITKSKVDRIFNDISIDPELYDGVCIKKSDRQSVQDVELVQCPVRPEPGYVYQKNIENKEGDRWIEYRVTYADGIKMILKYYNVLPFNLTSKEKKKRIIERIPIDSIFTASQEFELMIKCREFGFDYGEIDVLLDDGYPVVIDVNNVAGMGRGVDAFDPYRQEMADIFENFINKSYENRANKGY